MAQQKIMLGIPTLSGTVNAALMRYVCILMQSENERFKFVLPAMVAEKFPHWYARNLICRQFLESDCDKLWFFDDDIIPTEFTAAILDHDADIVSGMYMALRGTPDGRRYDPRPLLYKEAPESPKGGFYFATPDSPDEPVMDICAAGAGCLLIKRHVLEDKRMWYPTKYIDYVGDECDYMDENLPDNTRWAPPIFRHHHKPGGDDILSEDLDFCWRAKKNGYRLLGDFSARCGHIKRADAYVVSNSLAMAAMEMAKQLINPDEGERVEVIDKPKTGEAA